MGSGIQRAEETFGAVSDVPGGCGVGVGISHLLHARASTPIRRATCPWVNPRDKRRSRISCGLTSHRFLSERKQGHAPKARSSSVSSFRSWESGAICQKRSCKPSHEG